MAQPEQSEQPQQPEQPEHPASPQASAAAVEAAAIEIDEVEVCFLCKFNNLGTSLSGLNSVPTQPTEMNCTFNIASQPGSDTDLFSSSYSRSLTSSVLNYEWKHGRRYHAYQAGSVLLPILIKQIIPVVTENRIPVPK